MLAGVGVGGLVGTLASPPLVSRVGSRRTTIASGVGIAVTLPWVAVAPSQWTVMATLAAAGLLDAVTDISMNDIGAHVQRTSGRSLMNRLHAGWSLGSVTGAVAGSVVAARGVGLGTHLTVVAVMACLILAVAWRGLPDAPVVPRRRAPRRARVGVVVVLLPLAFATAIVEGVPGEWSAVFLATEHDLGPGAVGLGFTAFALGMLVGRAVGDRVVDRVGLGLALHCAAGTAVVGIAAIALSPSPTVAIMGFAVCGLGASVLFPVVYGLSASLSVVSSGAGLAVMSLGARLGFLAGPPLVGVLTDALSLRAALALLVVSGAVVVTVSRSRLDRYA